MKGRFTDEQIVGFLKQAEGGVAVKDLCRKHGFSDATFYKWCGRFGGMEATDVRKLRVLERANADVHSLVLTDIATGWTEAVPLIVRESTLVVETLEPAWILAQLTSELLAGFPKDQPDTGTSIRKMSSRGLLSMLLVNITKRPSVD